jgi:hypothetical protein
LEIKQHEREWLQHAARIGTDRILKTGPEIQDKGKEKHRMTEEKMEEPAAP